MFQFTRALQHAESDPRGGFLLQGESPGTCRLGMVRMSAGSKTRIHLLGHYVSSGQLQTCGRMGLGPGRANNGLQSATAGGCVCDTGERWRNLWAGP